MATKGLPTGWEAMVRLWLFQLAHTIKTNNITPKLVVRGNQIDIMLVTVEKRTYARLGAIAVLHGASMSDDLLIISAFSDPVVANRPFSCVM